MSGQDGSPGGLQGAASSFIHELVERYEDELVRKNLIYKVFSDDDYVTIGKVNRLTQYGFALCQFISHYEMPEPGEQGTEGNSINQASQLSRQ